MIEYNKKNVKITEDIGINRKLSGQSRKTARLRVTATAARNGGKYRCVVVDEEGVVATSSAGILIVV